MKKLIIVLAHQRTGSSLLMQTLRLLGVGVIGQFERKNLPQQANPKGYYEEKDILCKGITDVTIEQINHNRDETLALKVALQNFINDNRESQWYYLKEKQATILVTIRPPLESAVSRLVFNNKQDEVSQFRWITTFLRNYRLHYQTLSKILVSRVPELIPGTYTIDYHQALNNPQKYVQGIIDKLELTVSKSQVDNAFKNIDSTLYRFKQESFNKDFIEWNQKLGADQYYDILSTQKNPWKTINAFKDQ